MKNIYISVNIKNKKNVLIVCFFFSFFVSVPACMCVYAHVYMCGVCWLLGCGCAGCQGSEVLGEWHITSWEKDWKREKNEERKRAERLWRAPVPRPTAISHWWPTQIGSGRVLIAPAKNQTHKMAESPVPQYWTLDHWLLDRGTN